MSGFNPLFYPLLLYLVHRLLRQPLPKLPLDNVLLSRFVVSNRDYNATRYVTADGAAEDDSCEGGRAGMVTYTPGTGA